MTESVHPASHDDERPDEGVDAEPDTADETVPEEAADAVEETVGLTGNAQVDDAVRGVRELGERPVEEHVEVFEQAHSALRGALNDAAAGRPGHVGPGPRPGAPGPRPAQG